MNFGEFGFLVFIVLLYGIVNYVLSISAFDRRLKDILEQANAEEAKPEAEKTFRGKWI